MFKTLDQGIDWEWLFSKDGLNVGTELRTQSIPPANMPDSMENNRNLI